MSSKKFLVFLAIFFIIFALLKIPPLILAVQTADEQIPSDLALDLKQAEENPAPDQKLIAQVQVEKAQITTSKGEQAVVAVKEEIPQEIKTQSAKDAVNPQQTTSEQVVEKHEIISPNQPLSSTNPAETSPPGSNSVIPGTNLAEPDDNAASPLPVSTSNPTSSSEPASTINPISSSNPEKSESGAYSTPVETTPQSQTNSNSIPLENGNPSTSAPPPAGQPAAAATEPAPAPPAPKEESQPAPANNDSGSSGGSESSGGDSTAVQGVSTQIDQSWWQQFINRLLR